MELNERERRFVGIPAEFYDPNRKTVLTEKNIRLFVDSAKVLVVRNTEDFFAEAAKAFYLIQSVTNNINGCKTYTSLDLDLIGSHKELLEYLKEKSIAIIALLDIETAKNKPKIEALIRKWFEGGQSIIILCTGDLKKLEGYSEWFIDLLRKKSEWR